MESQLSLKVIRFLQKRIDDNQFQPIVDRNARVKNLPELIRRNGLLQTGWFLLSKEDSDKELLKLLLECMNALTPSKSVTDSKGHLQNLASKSAPEYLRQQALAVLCATWISRLADALDVVDTAMTADPAVEEGTHAE